ncbi:MAG: hypothetical protein E6Q92_06900 [Burkholderiaceae bacterium]|nr:MAG: hypothetical protein E6Q92_06900 [Burkholderiaceae bacterium]
MLSKIHPQMGPQGLRHLLSMEAMSKSSVQLLVQAASAWHAHPELLTRPMTLGWGEAGDTPWLSAWRALPSVTWCRWHPADPAPPPAADALLWHHAQAGQGLRCLPPLPSPPVLSLLDGRSGSLLEALACLTLMAATGRPWHEQHVLLLGPVPQSRSALPLVMAMGMLGVPWMQARAPRAWVPDSWQSLGLRLDRPLADAPHGQRIQALQGFNVLWVAQEEADHAVLPGDPDPSDAARAFAIWTSGRHDVGPLASQGVFMGVLDGGKPGVGWHVPGQAAQMAACPDAEAWTRARRAALLGALTVLKGDAWRPA